MLSKNQLKLITSLQQKKYRNKHGLFVAEGAKVVEELINANILYDHLFCTDNYKNISNYHNAELISEIELKKISSLKTPNKVLGVFKIPIQQEFEEKGLVLVLDAINDPGNLGTIIRLCDWFGIKQLICSTQTVDSYNPKVVQSSMGSLSRVSIIYTDLNDFLTNTQLPIYGAFMEGNNVYTSKLSSKGILIMGNEANGISSEIEQLVTRKLSIPKFGDLQKTESLNVATAAAILLSEFRRN